MLVVAQRYSIFCFGDFLASSNLIGDFALGNLIRFELTLLWGFASSNVIRSELTLLWGFSRFVHFD